ncbi:hypothetical protein NKH36_24245 [Mesorhizobium sp. M1312]|uniref:hypothetical protein n=1 Tax=unclassified Mesorhizobium TaxID=325217 RepID=UPI0033366EC6
MADRIVPSCLTRAVAGGMLFTRTRAFSARLKMFSRSPALQMQGFPKACPITGNYDVVAIDAWQDRRSGLAGAGSGAQSSAEIAKARLASLG